MLGPDDDQDGVEQRVVSAAEAPAPETRAASSVWNWRGAGNDTGPADRPPDTQPESQQQPEESMPRKTARTRRKPIPLILQLLSMCELPKKDIGEQLQLANSVLHRAMGKLKDDGLVAPVGDKFRITKAGREALAQQASEETEPAEAAPTRRARRSAGHQRKGGRRAAKPARQVDTSPADEDTAEATFRCAVMSDGCFYISKEGVSLELDPEEHKRMLTYLERMAEEA